MHELSVTESVLAIAIKHAEQSYAARVTSVNLVIGQLSSIVDESVQFYWDLITEHTLCEGSRLSFNRIPATFHCQDCDFDFNLVNELSACPQCGSVKIVIVTGEEFYLDSIEIEKKKVNE